MRISRTLRRSDEAAAHAQQLHNSIDHCSGIRDQRPGKKGMPGICVDYTATYYLLPPTTTATRETPLTSPTRCPQPEHVGMRVTPTPTPATYTYTPTPTHLQHLYA